MGDAGCRRGGSIDHSGSPPPLRKHDMPHRGVTRRQYKQRLTKQHVSCQCLAPVACLTADLILRLCGGPDETQAHCNGTARSLKQLVAVLQYQGCLKGGRPEPNMCSWSGVAPVACCPASPPSPSITVIDSLCASVLAVCGCRSCCWHGQVWWFNSC